VSEWWQIIVLAFIQGFSEFLPISSSAHLILPSQLLGWSDQGLMFDVAVHMGTLIAVIAYFWRDLIMLLGDLVPSMRSVVGGTQGELWRLVVATIPAVLAGALASDYIENHLRGIPVIATTTIVFGLLLGWAGYHSRAHRRSEQLGVPTLDQIAWHHAFIIGLAQMLALIPGTSRSGITITAALFLGYKPVTAARFSFLMSVPIISGAMLFLSLDLLFGGETEVPAGQILLAATIAGVTAYCTIALFLAALSRMGMMPFVVYRLLLGAGLVAIVFLGN